MLIIYKAVRATAFYVPVADVWESAPGTRRGPGGDQGGPDRDQAGARFRFAFREYTAADAGEFDVSKSKFALNR